MAFKYVLWGNTHKTIKPPYGALQRPCIIHTFGGTLFSLKLICIYPDIFQTSNIYYPYCLAYQFYFCNHYIGIWSCQLHLVQTLQALLNYSFYFPFSTNLTTNSKPVKLLLPPDGVVISFGFFFEYLFVERNSML